MRHSISGKEIRELNNLLHNKNIKYHIDKKRCVEIFSVKGSTQRLILVDKVPFFFYYNDIPIPTLKLLNRENMLKNVVIDMPAVRFITNGADVMRPGIKGMDNFDKGEIVSIVDELHNKVIAVGEALFSSDSISAMSSGKVIKNIHHVGDGIWEI